MNFKELDPPVIEIPKQEQWYRIQRLKALKDSVRTNGFILPPTGIMAGRFDLTHQATAYMADSPETALYESLFRREARSCTMGSLSDRVLTIFETTQRLRLVDLRGHEESFPVLQSLRYDATQQLAQDCLDQGIHGVIYASAQHPYHACLCLFANGIAAMRRRTATPLVEQQTQRLLKAVVKAAHGSRVPILE
ncbi:MAG: RES family NAD+ phosphorylase [Burkholderiaceae bacterium]|nr:RES family NAD+ phosphorylase [Burkholderiaceae bacterium]